MYQIKLSNNKVFTDLELNGDIYLTSEPIGPATFDNGLTKVEITDLETQQTKILLNPELVQICQIDNKMGFSLSEISEEEQARRTITNLELALTELYEMILER